MVRLFTTVPLILSILSVQAQQVQGTGEVNSHIYGDGFNARVREIPYTPGETKGSYYLFEHWSPGTITMTNGEKVEDVFLKYNFQKRNLEIKTDTAYLSMNDTETEEFAIYDDNQHEFRNFVAAQNYRMQETPLTGALEMLYQGKISLVARVAPKLIEANYKGALSGGSTNDKIVKEKEYFLVDGNQLIAVPTKKKQALNALQPYDPEIEQFIKDEKLKLKHEEDLITIAEHLSAL